MCPRGAWHRRLPPVTVPACPALTHLYLVRAGIQGQDWPLDSISILYSIFYSLFRFSYGELRVAFVFAAVLVEELLFLVSSVSDLAEGEL